MLSVVWLHRNSTVKKQNKTEKIQIIQNNCAPVGIWLFYGQDLQIVILSGLIQKDTDRCESANIFKELPLVWRLAVASILGRSDSHVKPQPHCAIENMDHLLREQQRSLSNLPPYRSLDISRQIPANQNGHRKDNYQAWKPLTQYTLNILRGWCFRASAAA